MAKSKVGLEYAKIVRSSSGGLQPIQMLEKGLWKIASLENQGPLENL